MHLAETPFYGNKTPKEFAQSAEEFFLSPFHFRQLPMTSQVIEIYIVARLSNTHEKTDSIAFCRFFFASYEVGEFENRKFEGIVRKSKS